MPLGIFTVVMFGSAKNFSLKIPSSVCPADCVLNQAIGEIHDPAARVTSSPTASPPPWPRSATASLAPEPPLSLRRP
jgi:hypothetical protein